MSPSDLTVVAARLPGLDHRLSTLGPHGVHRHLAALLAAAERHGARALALRREGELVVMGFARPTEAVEAALRLAGEPLADRGEPLSEQGVGAAIGRGPVLVDGGELFGAEVTLIRRLALLARVGEVLCTEAIQAGAPLPDGVGGFLAPAALSQVMGRPIHVLRDYR